MLILLALIIGIILIISPYIGVPAYVAPVLAILSLILVAIREATEEQRASSENAERELDSERIKKIDETINKENKELKEKHQILAAKAAIMKDFIKRGIVKEKEIIDNLNQKSFTILYHFNKGLPAKYRNLLPDKEKPMDRIIKQLGFVPVGSFAGSYFFHVVNTDLLPRELQQPAFLEAYVKKKVNESWSIIESELKKTNKKEYTYFKENSNKKVNLIYLIGKVFTTELRIGYLNYSNFDSRFLPYISSFAKRIKNVDKKKLNDLLALASLEYFVNTIGDHKDKQKIITNETKIKKSLGVNTLFDYQNISKEQWLGKMSELFDGAKAKVYSEIIFESIKRDLPIINEFV